MHMRPPAPPPHNQSHRREAVPTDASPHADLHAPPLRSPVWTPLRPLPLEPSRSCPASCTAGKAGGTPGRAVHGPSQRPGRLLRRPLCRSLRFLGPPYKQDGREAGCVGSTTWGWSPSPSRPLPRLSPVPFAEAHTPDGLTGGGSPFAGLAGSGARRCVRKESLPCQRPGHLSGAPRRGECLLARGLQEVKTCPCVYFRWRPRRIIICQHVRCGFICALKTARSGRMQTLHGALENVPAAPSTASPSISPF